MAYGPTLGMSIYLLSNSTLPEAPPLTIVYLVVLPSAGLPRLNGIRIIYLKHSTPADATMYEMKKGFNVIVMRKQRLIITYLVYLLNLISTRGCS